MMNAIKTIYKRLLVDNGEIRRCIHVGDNKFMILIKAIDYADDQDRLFCYSLTPEKCTFKVYDPDFI